MSVIKAKAGSHAYDIVVGKPLTQLPAALKQHIARGARIAIVADASVARYARPLQKALAKAGYAVHLLSIPSGERSKTLAQAGRIYRFCATAGLDRHSWLIAVGGGVVGDMAGFVAATYLRGISFVQVPTTLLAQVDSSIGGKTGVDIPEGKNLVGAFYQPKLVWIDPEVLASLPLAHRRNGMAEVIKYGAIADAQLFAQLEKHIDTLIHGAPGALLTSVIARCAAIKADVVQRDPHETRGLRAILNFGHSIGHAIEAASGYSGYLHGEAISIGMFVASFIAAQMELLSTVERIRLGALLRRAGLPSHARKPMARTTLLTYLSRDKKSQAGSVRFVLLKKLGKAVSGQQVPPELLDIALSAYGL